MALLTIDEPLVPPAKPSLANHPLFRLGFRPFYLLAAAFAAVAVPLWLLRLFGFVPSLSHINLAWHVHEMVFGFAIAVIIGFLYTAVRNWTGLQTPHGKHLAALAGLWLAGRFAMLVLPAAWAAPIDLAFLPAAAWPIYRVLKKSGNRRNMFLVVLLGLLIFANAVFHAANTGLFTASSLAPLQAAILIIVMIETVIAGRVIPGFTANAVPSIKPLTDKRRDQITFVVTAVTALAWIAGAPPILMASLALAAAVSQVLRLAGWKSYRTLAQPLLWILHVSYGWIPMGFAMLGLAALGIVSSSAAFHVLTIGSMAGLIIGMITRTALGHTGRRLTAGRCELLMYLLVQVGVLARLLAALNVASLQQAGLIVAAAAWSSAFLLYLIVYAPYLMAARVDGRQG
ncbi:MAG: NnrS family protein [Burkholderiales bacterium]|nr:NnrS family protein [Burkholderiales bacterium]